MEGWTDEGYRRDSLEGNVWALEQKMVCSKVGMGKFIPAPAFLYLSVSLPISDAPASASPVLALHWLGSSLSGT